MLVFTALDGLGTAWAAIAIGPAALSLERRGMPLWWQLGGLVSECGVHLILTQADGPREVGRVPYRRVCERARPLRSTVRGERASNRGASKRVAPLSGR